MTTPLTINTSFKLTERIQLKNRIVKSALSEVMADATGNPNQHIINLYQAWADSETAMLISGNMMVDRNNIGEAGNIVLDQYSDLVVFKKWTETVKKTQADIQFWAQLNHPGKQSPNFLTWKPVAPSAIALQGGLRAGFNKPRALLKKEIEKIISQFATAAELTKKIGFTGVQIHAAHGYLISQFLSPLHNHREDQWGGTLENRARFLMSVIRAVRKKVGPDFPISVKLNSADFEKDGYNEADYIAVVDLLNKEGIDLLEISGGNYEAQSMTGQVKKESTKKREAYFIEYAEKIRENCNIPILLTGGFSSVMGMNGALQDQSTDLIGLGRAFCVDTKVANKLFSHHEYKINLPKITTGFAFLDRLFVINISWYEHQLKQIAKTGSNHKILNAWQSICKTVINSGIYSIRKRRV